MSRAICRVVASAICRACAFIDFDILYVMRRVQQCRRCATIVNKVRNELESMIVGNERMVKIWSYALGLMWSIPALQHRLVPPTDESVHIINILHHCTMVKYFVVPEQVRLSSQFCSVFVTSSLDLREFTELCIEYYNSNAVYTPHGRKADACIASITLHGRVKTGRLLYDEWCMNEYEYARSTYASYAQWMPREMIEDVIQILAYN